MKTLYMISGTMGVGKTSVCQQLKKSLPKSVFLDGDWCWDADPFQVTEETKKMVEDNICYLLNNFLHCPAYENVIFCWVMHRQSIIDSLLKRLDLSQCEIQNISLLANEKSLRERLGGDVSKGVRSVEVIDRSIARIPMYDDLDTIKIFTDGKTIQMIADEIEKLSF